MNFQTSSFDSKKKGTACAFSKAVIKTDLKNNWPWAVCVLVVLFMNLVDYAGSVSPRSVLDLSYARYIGRFGFSLALAIIAGLFYGVKLFAYLDKANSVAFVHGLPFSRKKLYFSHILSGIVLMLLPAAISALFQAVTRVASLENITCFLLSFIIYSLISFTISVFAMTVCGNMIVSVLFYLAITLMPAIIISMIHYLCNMSLYGYDAPQYYSTLINHLYVFPHELMSARCIIYIVGAVAFAVAGAFVYKARPLENCEEVVAFKKLRPMFIYTLGFVLGLVGYFLFSSVWGGEASLLGMLPLGIIGTIGGTMLAKKTINLKGSLVHVAIYSACVILLSCAFTNDWFGYESRVPSASEVESVTIETAYLRGNHYNIENRTYPTFTSGEVIGATINLHKACINDRYPNYSSFKRRLMGGAGNLYIEYKLKNGGKIVRRYDYLADSVYSYLNELLSLPEVKKHRSPLLSNESAELLSVSVENEFAFESWKLNDKEKDRLFEAIKLDNERLSYDKLIAYQSNISIVLSYYLPGEYDIDGKKITPTSLNQKEMVSEVFAIRINKYHTETLKVLNELWPDMVPLQTAEKAFITTIPDEQYYEEYYEDVYVYPRATVTEQTEEYGSGVRENTIEITDKDTINQLMELCCFGTATTLSDDFSQLEQAKIRIVSSSEFSMERELTIVVNELPVTLRKYFVR